MNICTFERTEEIADNIWSFWFKPGRPLRYEAGQFIELTLPHDKPDDRGVKRWFTLSSSPTDQLLSITTKLADAPSTFKQHLFGLKTGENVTLSDAMGDFVLPKDKTTPLIFILGGIGVTPAHSIIKWLSYSQEQRTIHLVYAARTAREIAFKPLFDSYVSHADYIVQQPAPDWAGDSGTLTSTAIIETVQAYEKPLIYLSGPEEMVEVLVTHLKAAGTKPSRLVTDYFPGYGGTI